jgi:ribbon-helix-helix protein
VIPCSLGRTTRHPSFRDSLDNFSNLCDDDDCERCQQNPLKIAGKSVANLWADSHAIDFPILRIYFLCECVFFLTYIDIHSILADVKKRTTVWLPQELLERLKKLSRKTGAPMAELFRRAVEAYVKRQT